jgi:hypothetical protein
MYTLQAWFLLYKVLKYLNENDIDLSRLLERGFRVKVFDCLISRTYYIWDWINTALSRRVLEGLPSGSKLAQKASFSLHVMVFSKNIIVSGTNLYKSFLLEIWLWGINLFMDIWYFTFLIKKVLALGKVLWIK